MKDDIKEKILIIILTLIILMVVFLLQSCIWWGIGYFIIWVFHIPYAWTLLHGMCITIIIDIFFGGE